MVPEVTPILEDVIFIYLSYNQEKYIKTTLPTALNQTCFPKELLIFDDASTDQTDREIQAVLRDKPAQLNLEYVCNSQNVGLVGQLNKLFGRYQDKLIVLQAGDDESYPTRLAETYQAWITHGKPSLVLANYDCIDLDGNIVNGFSEKTKPEKSYTVKRLINRRSKVYGCCAAFSSDLLNYFGPMDCRVINEDRVNALRAFFLNGIYYLHKPLVKYRVGIGVSSFEQQTREERHRKLITEAERELVDIQCHLNDLKKIENSEKVRRLLWKRKRNVEYMATIEVHPTFLKFVKGFLHGIDLSVIAKIRRRLNKKKGHYFMSTPFL